MRAYLALVLVPVAATAWIAGCGDDDGASPATTDAGADTAVTPTPTTPTQAEQDAAIADTGTDARDASGACATNDDCQSGTCFDNACVCNEDSFVQPDGRCGATPPPTCTLQGGTCRRGPTCGTGAIQGSRDMDQSCGDIVAQVCCFDAGACRGTRAFVCCPDPSDGEIAPICINGWTTCKVAQVAKTPTADGVCPRE